VPRGAIMTSDSVGMSSRIARQCTIEMNQRVNRPNRAISEAAGVLLTASSDDVAPAPWPGSDSGPARVPFIGLPDEHVLHVLWSQAREVGPTPP